MSFILLNLKSQFIVIFNTLVVIFNTFTTLWYFTYQEKTEGKDKEVKIKKSRVYSK